MDKKDLDYFFGKESKGKTALEKAMTSTMLFVRSQDHLALYKPASKGLIMTAFDVYSIFGLDVMQEIFDKGSAIIVKEPNEPTVSLIRRREKKGITQDEVAEKTGLTLKQIQDAEDPNTRTDMLTLCKICIVLKINPKKISWISFG